MSSLLEKVGVIKNQGFIPDQHQPKGDESIVAELAAVTEPEQKILLMRPSDSIVDGARLYGRSSQSPILAFG